MRRLGNLGRRPVTAAGNNPSPGKYAEAGMFGWQTWCWVAIGLWLLSLVLCHGWVNGPIAQFGLFNQRSASWEMLTWSRELGLGHPQTPPPLIGLHWLLAPLWKFGEGFPTVAHLSLLASLLVTLILMQMTRLLARDAETGRMNATMALAWWLTHIGFWWLSANMATRLLPAYGTLLTTLGAGLAGLYWRDFVVTMWGSPAGLEATPMRLVSAGWALLLALCFWLSGLVPAVGVFALIMATAPWGRQRVPYRQLVPPFAIGLAAGLLIPFVIYLIRWHAQLPEGATWLNLLFGLPPGGQPITPWWQWAMVLYLPWGVPLLFTVRELWQDVQAAKRQRGSFRAAWGEVSTLPGFFQGYMVLATFLAIADISFLLLTLPPLTSSLVNWSRQLRERSLSPMQAHAWDIVWLVFLGIGLALTIWIFAVWEDTYPLERWLLPGSPVVGRIASQAGSFQVFNTIGLWKLWLLPVPLGVMAAAIAGFLLTPMHRERWILPLMAITSAVYLLFILPVAARVLPGPSLKVLLGSAERQELAATSSKTPKTVVIARPQQLADWPKRQQGIKRIYAFDRLNLYHSLCEKPAASYTVISEQDYYELAWPCRKQYSVIRTTWGWAIDPATAQPIPQAWLLLGR